MGKRLEKLKQDSWTVKEKDREYRYFTDLRQIVRRASDNAAMIFHMYNIPTPIDMYNQKREIKITEEQVNAFNWEEIQVMKDGKPVTRDNKPVMIKVARISIPEANWNIALTADKVDAYLSRFKLLGPMSEFLKLLNRNLLFTLLGLGVIAIILIVMIMINGNQAATTQKTLTEVLTVLKQTRLGA